MIQKVARNNTRYRDQRCYDDLLVHLWHNGRLIATVPVDPLLGDFHFVNLPFAARAGASTSETANETEAETEPRLRPGV